MNFPRPRNLVCGLRTLRRVRDCRRDCELLNSCNRFGPTQVHDIGQRRIHKLLRGDLRQRSGRPNEGPHLRDRFGGNCAHRPVFSLHRRIIELINDRIDGTGRSCPSIRRQLRQKAAACAEGDAQISGSHRVVVSGGEWRPGDQQSSRGPGAICPKNCVAYGRKGRTLSKCRVRDC
jgi:hypothetical protein